MSRNTHLVIRHGVSRLDLTFMHPKRMPHLHFGAQKELRFGSHEWRPVGHDVRFPPASLRPLGAENAHKQVL